MNWSCRLAFAMLALTLAAVNAHAAGTLDDYLTFSGFGTLGAVYSDYGLADFTGPLSVPNGAGHGRSWSLTPDSDLGAQANITMTDALTGVLQVLSRDDEDGNYKPVVEWANLKYDITSDLAVRVGREVLPTYERSETQNVGFSLPWVRVPAESTYTSTATRSDGVSLLYRVKTGAITEDVQFQWGTATEDLPGVAFNSNRAHVVILEDTLLYGSASLHLAYQSADSLGFPPARIALADVGFTYDPGAWFVTGDSNLSRDRYFGDFISGYVSGGVRLGRFAPYAFYATTHAQSVGTSGLKSLGDQDTLAAGVRWDFARNFDFKLQLQQAIIESLNDPAAFNNLQPGARVGDKANLLSLAVDVVF